MATKRQCRGCGNYKRLEEFYNLTSSPDGLHPDCKACCKVSRALEAVRKRDKKSKISVRQRVRAQILEVECDRTVTLAGVFKKDRGICGLCKKWVQPKKASMDHIQPLSKGGAHIWSNMQITHLRCNLVKGDRI